MKFGIEETRKRLLALGLGGICSLALSGCVFGDNAGEASPGPGPGAMPTAHCAELTPAQQKQGDSLVSLAQTLQAGDVEMIVSIKEGQWEGVNESRANQAIALYDQALQAAPGHCAALFGRAIARTGILLQNQSVNEAMGQTLQKGSETEPGAALPLAQAYKADRDEAAPLILRVASGLAGADKPYITERQERLSTEVLPQLDTVIAALNAVMANGDFSFTYTRPGGGLIEIDGGEVGPVLGGLKVARAVLLLICGYQWEIAQEGSYAWIDRVGDLSGEDFSHLTSSQRDDMDHLTGFFKLGNPFTRVKPEWKTAVQGIPSLLLEAVENTQAGLRYALAEADHPEKQVHDLYRVGTTESDDVDPKDLSGMIDALERTKKYLKGDVTLAYHKGTHTIRVNFPKVFTWDGFQNFLPNHTVRPYEQWFTPLASTDSAYEQQWSPTIGDYGAAFRKILAALDLSSSDAVGIRTAADGKLQVALSEEFNGWFMSRYYGPEIVLAELTPGADACEYEYVKLSGRMRVRPGIFGDDRTFVSTEDEGRGTVLLGRTCRVTDGRPEYLSYEYTSVVSPFYYTDAAGAKTLEMDEVETVASELGIAALTGKIVFKDPTFGGVFPDLNNDNIWSTIQSLDYSGARINEQCDENGKCTRELPNNPSDLDVWAHYLFWVDDIF